MQCATYCGVVAVVQLHLLSSSHPQKVSPPLGAAAGQRRSHFRSDPASSPATLAPPNFPIFHSFFIRFSAPCSINHFLVLPGSASSASVVSCQSPQSGCPGSTNPRPAAEKILDFVLRQIFLFSSRGDKLSVNPVYVASFQPRIRGNLQFRLIPAHFLPDTGKRKKLLSFHLINTRTGENVTVSHCRQTPALCREEKLRNPFCKKYLPCSSSCRFLEKWQSQLESMATSL